MVEIGHTAGCAFTLLRHRCTCSAQAADRAARRERIMRWATDQVTRTEWTREQWIDEAAWVMDDPRGSIRFLSNGHVTALLEEIQQLRHHVQVWRERSYRAENVEWSDALPPGGEVCADCGLPVESEPCPEHGPIRRPAPPVSTSAQGPETRPIRTEREVAGRG